MLRLAWMEPLPSAVALTTWSDPSLPPLIVADTDRLPRLPPPPFLDGDDDVASSAFFREDEPLGFLPDGDAGDAVAVVGMEGKAGMDWWPTELRAGDESASGCTGREFLEPRPPPGEFVGAPSAGAESETERRTLVAAAAAAEVSMQCCSGEG
jgi:hypothetical protein